MAGLPGFSRTLRTVAGYSLPSGCGAAGTGWLDAFHAADAEPLEPGDLARHSARAIWETTFTPHPATRIVRSRFAAVSIFSASREERTA
jgi:hypothetical protein